MYTANIKLFDRSTSEVVFTQRISKSFKTTKAADKFLYAAAAEIELPRKDLWLVGAVYNADGKIEYNIGLL